VQCNKDNRMKHLLLEPSDLVQLQLTSFFMRSFLYQSDADSTIMHLFVLMVFELGVPNMRKGRQPQNCECVAPLPLLPSMKKER
jgi:hypothetical protein